MRNNLPIHLELPEDYLNEEERCGFIVTKERKELWAVLLDLLSQFDIACKSLNINYYAGGGTALGAVRHKGFIPWDDDIDLYVLRDDYNKLCEKHEKLFSYPYFFQTEWTDPGTIRGHAQLRNSETTAILNSERGRHCTFNQGAFIDIFPIDNLPDGDEERKHFVKKLRWLKFAARNYAEVTTKDPAKVNKYRYLIKKTISYIVGPYYRKHSINFFYKKLEETVQMYNRESCAECGEIVFDPGNYGLVFRKECFNESIRVPFEMITIPISTKSGEMLTKQYGDWSKMVKQDTSHGEVFFDMHRPYTDYI